MDIEKMSELAIIAFTATDVILSVWVVTVLMIMLKSGWRLQKDDIDPNTSKPLKLMMTLLGTITVIVVLLGLLFFGVLIYTRMGS